MKKFFRIFLLVLLGSIVILTLFFLWQKSQPKVNVYQIETPEKTVIEKRTVATGKVEPRYEILIKPQMSGIIAEVYCEAGDRIKAGDIIAKIKVVPDMVNLNAAESRVQLAQIQFDQSERTYQRDKKLFAEQVISREEYERTEMQYSNSKEELKTAKDNLSLTRDGISSSKSHISNTLVRSTIDGMVLDVPVKAGNSVIQSNNFNDGTTIASVANLNDMLFVGKLDETEIGRIKIGMPMDITIGAIQDVHLDAVIEYVSPKGVEESGAIMFEMKAAVNVPDTVFIRAGYSSNAEIVLAQTDSVLAIPESCIEFNNDTAFLYILQTEKPQAFERKQVEIGMSDGIRIEIKSGLNKDDKVRGAEITNKPKK